MPIGPAVGEAVSGFAHEFALTRSVRDTAALLDAVSGPAPGDRYYVASPEAAVRDGAAAPRRRRCGWRGAPSSPFGDPVDPHVRAAVEDVLRVLEEMGHEVVEDCPPVDEQRLRDCLETTWSVDLAGLAGTFGRIAGGDAQAESVEAASRACIERGRRLSALELEAAAATVNSVSRRWGRFLEEHQLFVCPTTPAGPPPSGSPDQDDERVATAAGWIDAVFAPSPFTPLANLTGQPSISLPLGEGPDGMPIGVMLTAQTLREDVLLAVAAALEQAMPWDGTRGPRSTPRRRGRSSTPPDSSREAISSRRARELR